MIATTNTLPLPTVIPEVQAFATEKGVAAYLPAILEMTRRLCPTSRIRLTVEEDVADPEVRQIIVEADLAGMDANQICDTIHRWNSELFQLCPATHVHVFCFGVE